MPLRACPTMTSGPQLGRASSPRPVVMELTAFGYIRVSSPPERGALSIGLPPWPTGKADWDIAEHRRPRRGTGPANLARPGSAPPTQLERYTLSTYHCASRIG